MEKQAPREEYTIECHSIYAGENVNHRLNLTWILIKRIVNDEAAIP